MSSDHVLGASAMPNGPRGDGHVDEERRCLVVDDEPRLRQALVRLMQLDGFTCFEAGSGVEALEILAREPVILVLSDLRMPKMDGALLLREVRERYPDVAVIMITAVAEVEVAVECLGRGAMDYISKPFVLEEVRARVKQALEKRRLVIENREYHHSLEKRVRGAGAPAGGALHREHPVAWPTRSS